MFRPTHFTPFPLQAKIQALPVPAQGLFSFLEPGMPRAHFAPHEHVEVYKE